MSLQTRAPASLGKKKERFDAKELLAVLGDDLKQIEEDLSAIGAHVASPMTSNIAEASQELRQSVKSFLDKAESAKDAVAERAKERAEAVHERMAAHPVAAAGSALALGYLLGRTALARRPHADS